jgi:excisionase family DNA binding protein
MNDLRLKVKKTREGAEKVLKDLAAIEEALNDHESGKDRFNETLTLKELAEILGIHYSTIRRHVKEGNIPVKKIGRKYFFLKADLPGLMKKLEAEELN